MVNVEVNDISFSNGLNVDRKDNLDCTHESVCSRLMALRDDNVTDELNLLQMEMLTLDAFMKVTNASKHDQFNHKSTLPQPNTELNCDRQKKHNHSSITYSVNFGLAVSKIKPVINIPVLRLITQTYTFFNDAISFSGSREMSTVSASSNKNHHLSSFIDTLTNRSTESSPIPSDKKTTKNFEFSDDLVEPLEFTENLKNDDNDVHTDLHSNSPVYHPPYFSSSSESESDTVDLDNDSIDSDTYLDYSDSDVQDIKLKNSSIESRHVPPDIINQHTKTNKIDLNYPNKSNNCMPSPNSPKKPKIKLIKQSDTTLHTESTLWNKLEHVIENFNNNSVSDQSKKIRVQPRKSSFLPKIASQILHGRNKSNLDENELYIPKERRKKSCLHLTVLSWISITNLELCTDVGDLLLQANLCSTKGSMTIYKCIKFRCKEYKRYNDRVRPISLLPNRGSLFILVQSISLKLNDIRDFKLPVVSFNIAETRGLFSGRHVRLRRGKYEHIVLHNSGSTNVVSICSRIGLVTVDVPLILLDIHRLVTKNTEKITTTVLEYFPNVQEHSMSTQRPQSPSVQDTLSFESVYRVNVDIDGICLSDSLHTNLKAQYTTGVIDCHGIVGKKVELCCFLTDHFLTVMYKLGDPESEAGIQFPSIKLHTTHEIKSSSNLGLLQNMDMMMNVDKLKHTMPVDVLAELVFVLRVFLQSISKIFSKIDFKNHFSRLNFGSSCNDSHFKYHFNAVLQGIELTCRTSSCTAIRMETGSQPTRLSITNWINDHYFSSRPYISSNLGIFLGLGRLISAQDTSEFQQAAYFRTIVNIENIIEKRRTDRDLFQIQVTKPLFYLQPGGVDAAILFWISYKNAFDYCCEQRISGVREELMFSNLPSPERSLLMENSDEFGNSFQSELIDPAKDVPNDNVNNEFQVLVNLIVTDLGVAFRLEQKPLVQIGDLDSAHTIVFTLDRTDISGASFGKLVFAGSFSGFCLRFVDQFVATYDRWSSPEGEIHVNKWVVPFGNYQIFSKTGQNNSSPVLEMIISWRMKGISIDLYPTIGRDFAMFVKALSYAGFFLETQEESISESSNEIEKRKLILRKYIRILEKRLKELRGSGAAHADVENMVQKLQTLESKLMADFLKEIQKMFKSSPMTSKDKIGGRMMGVVERRVANHNKSRKINASAATHDNSPKLDLSENVHSKSSDCKLKARMPFVKENYKENRSLSRDTNKSFVDFRLNLQIHIESGHSILHPFAVPLSNQSEYNEDCVKMQKSPLSNRYKSVSTMRFVRRKSFIAGTANPRQLISERDTEFYLPGILVSTNYSSTNTVYDGNIVRNAKLYCQCFVQSISNCVTISPYFLDFIEQVVESSKLTSENSAKNLARHVALISKDCDSDSLISKGVVGNLSNNENKYIQSSNSRDDKNFECISAGNVHHKSTEQKTKKSERLKSSTTSLEASGNSEKPTEFNLDIIVSVAIQPSTLLFTCYPWSSMECELRSPSIDLIFTRISRKEDDLDRVEKGIFQSSKRNTLNCCSIDAKNFMLNVFHPSCASENFKVNTKVLQRSALILEVSSALCNISRERYVQSLLDNDVKISVILSIGKSTFDYDVRKLQEILSFPRAWYSRSLMRRMFIGDQDEMSEKRKDAEASMNNNENNGNNDKNNDYKVSQWKSHVVLAVNVDEVHITMKMGNIMGIVSWTTTDIASNIQIMLDNSGYRQINGDLYLDLSKFVSEQGIIGGLFRLKDIYLIGEIKESINPKETIYQTLKGRLKALEFRLDYMTESTMLFRVCDFTIKLFNNWTTLKPNLPTLLCNVNIDFNQLHAMINASTRPDIIRMHVKLKEFIEQQLQSSRSMLFTLRTDRASSSECYQIQKRQKAIKVNTLKQNISRHGGRFKVSGNNLSIVVYHALNFRGRQWAVFSINEPILEFQSDSTAFDPLLPKKVVHKFQMQTGALSRENDKLNNMVSISRVIKGVLVPAQYDDIREWFDYALLAVDAVGFRQFPTIELHDAVRDNGFDQSTEIIFVLPKATFSLCNSNDGFDNVHCSFDSDFSAHSLFTFNADHYMFLHDLIFRYISETSKAIRLTSHVKRASQTEDSMSTNSKSEDHPIPPSDNRIYDCPEECWKLEPTIKLIAPYGAEVEPVGADKLLARLGFKHARITIPKWLQRNIMDPSQRLISTCTGFAIIFLSHRVSDRLSSLCENPEHRPVKPDDKSKQNP